MIIETVRCNLTSLRADDLEHVVILYTDKRVRQFLGGPVDEKDVHSEFLTLIESNSETHRWAIRLKKDDIFLGIISLEVHHDGTDIEVSYQLLPEWWGQGYATETVQAIVSYALDNLGLSRVIAETQTANIASCRLLERLGMRLERTVKRFGAEQAIYTTVTTSIVTEAG